MQLFQHLPIDLILETLSFVVVDIRHSGLNNKAMTCFTWDSFMHLAFGYFPNGGESHALEQQQQRRKKPRRRPVYQIFHHFLWNTSKMLHAEIVLWRHLLQTNVSSVRFLFLSNDQLKQFFRRSDVRQIRRMSAQCGELNSGNGIARMRRASRTLPYAKLKRLEIGHVTDTVDMGGLLRMSKCCGPFLQHFSVKGFFMSSMQSTDEDEENENGNEERDSDDYDDNNDGNSDGGGDVYTETNDHRRTHTDGQLEAVMNDDNDSTNGDHVTVMKAHAKTNLVAAVKLIIANLPNLKSLAFEREWVGSLGVQEDQDEVASGESAYQEESSSQSSDRSSLMRSIYSGFRCFQHSHQLRKVALTGMFPSADVNTSFNVLELVDSLAQFCPQLRELDLQRAAFAPMMFSQVMLCLSSMPKLRRVKLDQCDIDDRMVKSLCKIQQRELKRYRSIAAAAAVADEEQETTDGIPTSDLPIEELSSHNHTQTKAILTINSHTIPERISELSLASNKIGKWGLWHLLHCGHFRSLDLSYNPSIMLQKGALEQIMLPTVSTNISKLVLSMTNSVTTFVCRIKDDQARILFSQRFLKHLDLSGNAISGSAPDTFSPLKDNHVLEHLDLSHNFIGNQHARLLVQETSPNLQYLNLNHNRITDIDLLSAVQEGQSHIGHLEIEENDYEEHVDFAELFDEGR